MQRRVGDVANEENEHSEPIREMLPSREAGWIFRDGDARAIERRGTHTAARSREE